MKVSNGSFVFFFLAFVSCSAARGAAPNGVETSSDPSFDPQLFPKLAIIVVEEGAERTSVTVKRTETERTTSILFSDQTRLERTVDDEFTSALMNKQYTLSTRSDLLSILKEQAIQDLDLTENNSVSIGKVLKVQAVMLVRVTTTSKSSVSLGARLIGVDGARILWTGRYTQLVPVTDTSRRVQAIAMAAKRIASAFPKRELRNMNSFATPARERLPVIASDLPSTITNSIGMKFVLIPSGEFNMGSTEADVADFLEEAKSKSLPQWYIDRLPSESPKHRVRITKPFYLAISEVTQVQYERVVGSNPSKFKDNGTCPVEMVSWYDAWEFCRKLSELPEERASREKYRLPTEAEWEYACRAGTTTTWHSGNDEADLKDIAWLSPDADGKTHPVCNKRPNAWGLYDMHGNVWEWCTDWSGDRYYATSPLADPTGPPAGSNRVCRGGGWWSRGTSDGRTSFRSRGNPSDRIDVRGFRVAKVIGDGGT